MPLSFWHEVRAAERDVFGGSGIAVSHRMQSNLTCLTPASAALLATLLGPRGCVGTSADPVPGVRELACAGEGEYEARWKRGLGLLAEHGIRYGIVYVVHRGSRDRLEAIYRHFRREHPRAGLRFNPLYRQGRAGEDAVWQDLGITADQWGEALAVLYDCWTRDGRPAGVQPFGPWWHLFAEGRWRLSCESSGRCVETHFGVDPAGGVFLCGRSADGASLRFGSVHDLTAEALLAHPARQALANRAIYLRRTYCRECPWWRYCHGGCVNDSLLGHGTPFAPTFLCRGLRRFFDRAFGGGEREEGSTDRCVA
jgi:uncharacterized protein